MNNTTLTGCGIPTVLNGLARLLGQLSVAVEVPPPIVDTDDDDTPDTACVIQTLRRLQLWFNALHNHNV